MLDINISQEVKDYLRMRESKTFTIYTKLMTSCWSSMLDIFVRLREPVVPENYNKYEVEGINVFLYKDAVLKGDSIEIELSESSSYSSEQDFVVHGLKI